MNFSLLDTTTYFMSKCISLVEILHDLLKEKDIQVYEKIKARVCEELKWSMERAIDQYNQELESENQSTQGEQNVKQIAHMFKLI